MEKTLFDLGAFVRHAKIVPGHDKIAIVRWIGDPSERRVPPA